jgi:glutaredoxin
MNLEIKGNVVVRHQSVPDCEWCDKAKDLLDQKGIKYSIVESDKKLFYNLMKETNSKKVPQIILDGKFVGDYNDLLEHFDVQG